MSNKDKLMWAVALIIMAALAYIELRYFWPWYVKWCMAQ